MIEPPPIGGGPSPMNRPPVIGGGPHQLVGAPWRNKYEARGEIASLNFLIDNGFTSCVARFNKCSKFQPNPQACYRFRLRFLTKLGLQLQLQLQFVLQKCFESRLSYNNAQFKQLSIFLGITPPDSRFRGE